jgi:hypothetical protein
MSSARSVMSGGSHSGQDLRIISITQELDCRIMSYALRQIGCQGPLR